MTQGFTRRRLLGAAAALPGLGLLSACDLTVPGQRPPPTLYRLTPKSTFSEDLPTVTWQLVLEPPLANAGLNSTRIGLQRTPTLFEYYARANWADRAPLMVQTLMIESFENSGRIVSIGRESAGLRADFILKTELREFQSEYYTTSLPNVRVAVTAKLVKMPRRAIIGSETFEHLVEAETDQMEKIVDAFDQALGKVMRRLVEWTLTTGQASTAGS
jgi:cholesterol transport system auxiliary component